LTRIAKPDEKWNSDIRHGDSVQATRRGATGQNSVGPVPSNHVFNFAAPMPMCPQFAGQSS
jgi:hypothetical protein